MPCVHAVTKSWVATAGLCISLDPSPYIEANRRVERKKVDVHVGELRKAARGSTVCGVFGACDAASA
jgi:hypothetical protein